MAQKRAFNEGKRHFKKNKKQKTSTVNEGTNEEVLLADVRNLLKQCSLSGAAAETKAPEEQTEVDVDIIELSSTGDGLAHKDGQVYVVPFAVPGDTVTAKVYRHDAAESYALADFVKVVKPSEHRTEKPPCPYFTKCSGCQFQHLPYSYQLHHKRSIVERAYQNFSNLPASAVPTVGDTIGSPLQYGYRTKLTPHFDGPQGGRRDKRKGLKVTWPEVPPIGFMLKGTRKTMDIEDCPIGTDAVRKGMKKERARVAADIDKYQRGATLLLREHTKRVEKGDKSEETPEDVVVEEQDDSTLLKTCITDPNGTSSEYIDGFRFDNPAGAFFQNNNSILPLITQYIRDNILESSVSDSPPPIRNLIDAYCGSGFFTVTLSQIFTRSIGIDISPSSITAATRNATLNNLPSSSVNFLAGDANSLFASIPAADFPPNETAVIIDPPRKGCDEGFISQLMDYGPKRICYVSCNVHTQARDVGWLVGGLGERDGMYDVESLRGFDFFPQTSHVEGVAILRRKDSVSHGGDSLASEKSMATSEGGAKIESVTDDGDAVTAGKSSQGADTANDGDR
ncbi:tRNA(m5U54)methyltransferase [Oleoguttula sp. CCFEE 5521]